MIENNEINIFKDIPPQILMEIERYKFLTQLLKNLKIDFRWEGIEDLSVMYKQRRCKIDNIEKVKDMEQRIKREKEDERTDRIHQTREWRVRRHKENRKENNNNLTEETGTKSGKIGDQERE